MPHQFTTNGKIALLYCVDNSDVPKKLQIDPPMFHQNFGFVYPKKYFEQTTMKGNQTRSIDEPLVWQHYGLMDGIQFNYRLENLTYRTENYRFACNYKRFMHPGMHMWLLSRYYTDDREVIMKYVWVYTSFGLHDLDESRRQLFCPQNE